MSLAVSYGKDRILSILLYQYYHSHAVALSISFCLTDLGQYTLYSKNIFCDEEIYSIEIALEIKLLQIMIKI